MRQLLTRILSGMFVDFITTNFEELPTVVYDERKLLSLKSYEKTKKNKKLSFKVIRRVHLHIPILNENLYVRNVDSYYLYLHFVHSTRLNGRSLILSFQILIDRGGVKGFLCMRVDTIDIRTSACLIIGWVKSLRSFEGKFITGVKLN